MPNRIVLYKTILFGIRVTFLSIILPYRTLYVILNRILTFGILIMKVDIFPLDIAKGPAFCNRDKERALLKHNIENNTQASLVANRIINVMQEVQEIAATVISATASIGIALYPANGNTSAELFKSADIAMYRAKKKGRNQVCFFEHEMQQIFHHRLKIETELKTAIEKKQFELYYQPVINPINDTIQGFEALIRWKVDGVVRMPDQFIEIAEDSGQIGTLGLSVLRQACVQAKDWARPVTLSIPSGRAGRVPIRVKSFLSSSKAIMQHSACLWPRP